MLKQNLRWVCAAAAVAAIGCGDDVYPTVIDLDAGADASAADTSPEPSAQPSDSQTPTASSAPEDGGGTPEPSASSQPSESSEPTASGIPSDVPDAAVSASGAPSASASDVPDAAVSLSPDSSVPPDASALPDGGPDEPMDSGADAGADAGDGGDAASTVTLPTSTGGGGGGPTATATETPTATSASASTTGAVTGVPSSSNVPDSGSTSDPDAGGVPSVLLDSGVQPPTDAAASGSALPDGGVGLPDSGTPGVPDAGLPDASFPPFDSGVLDAGSVLPDGAVPDAALADAALPDAAASDAGGGTDTDNDGIADAVDTDDDNDGVPDSVETNGAYGATLFSSNFDSLNGGGVGSQFDTANTVYVGPSFSDWVVTGSNIHGVQHSLADYAATFYDGNEIEMATALPLNTIGVTYEVSFDGGPSVWANGSQATAFGAGLVFEVVNSNDQVVDSYVYFPPLWAGSQTLQPASFTFVGDGTGDVRLRIRDNAIDDLFGGAVDNVLVRPFYTSDPLDPMSCGNSDADMCDDCSVTGTFADDGVNADPMNDGPDIGSDGICDPV